MERAKLNVLAGFLAYGGNGGVATLLPEIMFWWTKVCTAMAKDDRIGHINAKKFGDVPLTMERNRMVRVAKDLGADVLLMIDSDNIPDLYEGVLNSAKPFWQTSFDFLYERKMRGLPTVVAAPYCGPPPHPVKGGMENVYVFHGEVMEGDVDKEPIRLTAYSREYASQLRGIQPMAAGPTGCIMYSTDAFDVMPVHKYTQEQILNLYKTDQISVERACRLLNMQSWFFYEYTDGEQTEKASTDDVTNTREISLAGFEKFGEPIVFCNWDSWAGHAKPKIVGKPMPVCIEQVNALYREAVEKNVSRLETIQSVNFTEGLDLGNVLPADEDELVEEEAEVDETLQQEKSINMLSDPRTIDPENIKPEVQWARRTINGRHVMSVGGFGGGQTPIKDLDALAEIVHLVASSRPKEPLRIVEIGSWVGESAIAMHKGFGPFGGTIWCVDTWEGSPSDMSSVMAKEIGFEKLFDIFRDNVGDLLDKSIKVIRGDSTTVAQSMTPQALDMVFFDADHTYESTREGLRVWLPHLAPHGIFAGHDFTDGFPGVAKAVKEVCDEAGIMPRLVNGTSVWYFPMREYLEGLEKHKSAPARPKRARKQRTLDMKEAPTDGQPVAAASL